jgi:hypothetical protein
MHYFPESAVGEVNTSPAHGLARLLFREGGSPQNENGPGYGLVMHRRLLLYAGPKSNTWEPLRGLYPFSTPCVLLPSIPTSMPQT